MLAVKSLSVGAISALLVSIVAPLSAEAQICQPRTPASGKECFVSRSGSDGGPGTLARPFRTIARGISVVEPGDVLSCGGVCTSSR